jgi:hypothetical protein
VRLLLWRLCSPSIRSKDCNGFPSPHAAGDALFLLADGVGVDGGRGDLRVAKPALGEVEGNALETAETPNAWTCEAMRQSALA